MPRNLQKGFYAENYPRKDFQEYPKHIQKCLLCRCVIRVGEVRIYKKQTKEIRLLFHSLEVMEVQREQLR